MDKIVNIQNVDPNTFQLQNYNVADESLISSYTGDITFDPAEDYLEYFILDLNKKILFSNTAGYPNYRIHGTEILIDPQHDLELQGYEEGQYYTVYNFLRRKLSSSPNSTFYIENISTDRTEIRLNTTSINSLDVITLSQDLANEIANSTITYVDFCLDFGDNKLVIANNIFLDSTTNPGDPTVLIKLYEPLPTEFTIQSQCWVVQQVAESKAYQIELTTVFNFTEQLNYISGPNFNLNVQDQVNNSTAYASQNTLHQNTSVLGSGSLLYQINSILAEKGIEININYSDYSQFVHFSSAQTRLENFYYKLALIEEYSYSSSFSNSTPTNYYVSSSQQAWNNKINDIITNFDGYEYYLYYSSESNAWPKTNSTAPYINYSVNSSTALNWFTTQSISASYFDSENNDALVNTIPTYLREDPNNDQYMLFTQMLGQNFDNVWVYLKDITNKFDADNRLNFGISKDIVAQAIRDLGVKIYQNNFSSTDLYSALLGLTPSGSNFNIPGITGSLPTPTGLEYINTFITASDPNALEPLDDVNKEIYKRIYHNLPYLLKKKGTVEGLRTLINIYGIPDTIIRINEFGGKSTTISNNWDNYQNQFNYAFNATSSSYMTFTSPINPPQSSYSFEVRFKTSGTPKISSFSQSIASITPSSSLNLFLEYTGSGYASGSYTGSIVNPYNTYGNLWLKDTLGNSSSVYLPFFDGGWWSVLVTVNSASVYTNTLYAKNSIYDGEDGNALGFQASSSFTGSVSFITSSISSRFYLSYPTNRTFFGKTYTPFSGSFQEVRIYNNVLGENHFDDYVMNPYSIEGNQLSGSQSSLNSLVFRAPLGTLLDTSGSIRTSAHPAYTLIPSVSSSVATGSTYYLSGSYTFIPNYEVIYQDQFHAGIKNAVTEKIRIVSSSLPSGDTLSHYISIQQHTAIDETFTKDINYIEVAFSPQDEINDDIISQLGSFNIGEYIGDPRQVSSSLTYYPDFNKLRDDYFSKYTSNYNLWDYIRLIKFYDNSLFKMIQDFTPARAGLASGIVIKQTMLERNKYPLPQATTNSTIAIVGSPTTRTINIGY
jgi:hypothetical protein